MQQTAFLRYFALAVKTSLLSYLVEELMKTLQYLAPYLIQVPWMKNFFPSHLRQRIYNYSSILLKQRDT